MAEAAKGSRNMRHEATVQQAYDGSAGSYDDMISLRSWWAQLAVKLVWGFPDTAYSNRLLDGIPEEFSGTLLDAPVGTGALTAQKYRRLQDAHITGIDYSQNMLDIATGRFASLGINHVECKQADVGALPFEDGSFDKVLTMNGLHAFPNKDAALQELRRVLKLENRIIGCCYVRGEVRRTDWVVRYLYTPQGFFTPPYWTKGELEHLLQTLFTSVDVWTVGAIAGFTCVR
jgi:ubiquinone/menaquinone biosynthesis C-methylase UbiE